MALAVSAPGGAQQSFVVTSESDGEDPNPGDGICTTEGGECTLRAALQEANSRAGLDTVTFSIPDESPYTIVLQKDLPEITDPIVIDGYSQSGSMPNSNPSSEGSNAVLAIVIDARNVAGSGLAIAAGGSLVRGLKIQWPPQNGIRLTMNGGNRIEGNMIQPGESGRGIYVGSTENLIGGTHRSARNVIGNGDVGIFLAADANVVQGNEVGVYEGGSVPFLIASSGIVVESSNNVIGGPESAARNIVSSSGDSGIEITGGGGNLIQGNLIGTDVTGLEKLGNGRRGIRIRGASAGNLIGGPNVDEGNVISNNGLGILLDEGSRENTIQGNRVGTDITGAISMPNDDGGIMLLGTSVSGNLIGGRAPGMGNQISGNAEAGLRIEQGASDNLVQGNLIGTDPTGTVHVPNLAGITISGDNNIVGGAEAGAGNVVAGNGAVGIAVSGSSGTVIDGNYIGTDETGTVDLGNGQTGVKIWGSPAQVLRNTIAFNKGPGVSIGRSESRVAVSENSIYQNGGLGIDLNGDGVTLNDPGDADTGPNSLQNYPVLTGFSLGASTTAGGAIESTASTTFVIEVFSTPRCHGSGHGQGRVYLGATEVTTDGSGLGEFTAAFPKTTESHHLITATATGPVHGTSEFSPCIGEPDFRMSLTPDDMDVLPGRSGEYEVSVVSEPWGDPFQDEVALSCRFLPPGMSCLFEPETVRPGVDGAVSKLTASTSSSTTPTENLGFSVVGSSGTIERAVESALTLSDFALEVTPDTIDIAQGESRDFTVSVVPKLRTFDASVSLTCADPKSLVICSFSPAAVTPGNSSVASTLTVRTVHEGGAKIPTPRWLGLWLILALGATGLATCHGTNPGRSRPILVGAVGIITMASGWACGGNSTPTGPPADRIVTLTVTGTWEDISRDAELMLNLR